MFWTHTCRASWDKTVPKDNRFYRAPPSLCCNHIILSCSLVLTGIVQVLSRIFPLLALSATSPDGEEECLHLQNKKKKEADFAHFCRVSAEGVTCVHLRVHRQSPRSFFNVVSSYSAYSRSVVLKLYKPRTVSEWTKTSWTPPHQPMSMWNELLYFHQI